MPRKKGEKMSAKARANYDAAMQREVERRRKLGLNLHGPLQFRSAKSFYGYISMLPEGDELNEQGKQVSAERVFELYEKLPLAVQSEVVSHPAFIKIAGVVLALYGMGKLDLNREAVNTWKTLFANSRNAHSHDWDRREGDARKELKEVQKQIENQKEDDSPEALTKRIKNAEIYELVASEDDDG